MFTSREIFLGKRGARGTFFHHEDTVDVDTSFQQCETRQETGKRRGKEFDVKGLTKVYRNVGHKQYTCFKSILFILII